LSYDEDGSFIIDTPNDETEDQVDVENNQQEAARKESNTVKKANQEVATRPPFIAPRMSRSDSTQDAMNNYIQFMMINREQDKMERQRERDEEIESEKTKGKLKEKRGGFKFSSSNK